MDLFFAGLLVRVAWAPTAVAFTSQPKVIRFRASLYAAVESASTPAPTPARVMGSPSSAGSSVAYIDALQGFSSWDESPQGRSTSSITSYGFRATSSSSKMQVEAGTEQLVDAASDAGPSALDDEIELTKIFGRLADKVVLMDVPGAGTVEMMK